MFIRQAKAVLPVLLLLTMPRPSVADGSGDLVQQLRQSIGGDLPRTIHVTASGTGYTFDGNQPTRSYWIKSYALDADLRELTASEQVVRVDDVSKSDAVATATRALGANGSPEDQVRFWTTVHGFIAGAALRQPKIATEMLYGQTYDVISFVTPAGQTVRGYVNADHQLERIRTSYRDPARGNVDIEQIFRDWSNEGGVTFPRMLITHENGQTARILIVKDVRAASGASES